MALPVVLDEVQKRFRPTNAPNLKVWVAGDLGLSLNDNDLVAPWPDQSGQGNDLVQATGDKKPSYQTNEINGRPVVRSDGTDDVLSALFTLSDPVEYFLVAKQIAHADGDTLIADGDLSNSLLLQMINPTRKVRMYSGSDGGPEGDPGAGFHIYTCLFNGASSELWFDGASQGSADCGTSVLVGVSLFGGNIGFAQIDIAEFCLFSAVLSSFNRNSMHRYLSSRYAISL